MCKICIKLRLIYVYFCWTSGRICNEHIRFAMFLFLQALEKGLLAEGGVVTEGSAGSTAISLATVAPAYGCKCHVVIPDDAAIEKVCHDP